MYWHILLGFFPPQVLEKVSLSQDGFAATGLTAVPHFWVECNFVYRQEMSCSEQVWFWSEICLRRAVHLQTARKGLGGRCLYEVICFEFVFKSNFTISLNVFLPRKVSLEIRCLQMRKFWGRDGELLVSPKEQSIFETVWTPLFIGYFFILHSHDSVYHRSSFTGEQMCIPVHLPYWKVAHAMNSFITKLRKFC